MSKKKWKKHDSEGVLDQMVLADEVYAVQTKKKSGDVLLGMADLKKKPKNKAKNTDKFDGFPDTLNNILEGCRKEKNNTKKKHKKKYNDPDQLDKDIEMLVGPIDDDDDDNDRHIGAEDIAKMIAKKHKMERLEEEAARAKKRQNQGGKDGNQHKPNQMAQQNTKAVQESVQKTQTPVNTNTSAPKAEAYRQIRFRLFDGLNRGIMTDGILPTGITLSGYDMYEEIYGEYSDDELLNYADICIKYAIMTRHPVAVFEAKDVIKKLEGVVYDDTKYMLTLAHGMIYGYAIDQRSYMEFRDTLFKAGDGDVLLYALNAIVFAEGAAQFLNCAFIDDLDYMDVVENEYMTEAGNEAFLNDLLNDPTTVKMENDKSVNIPDLHSVAKMVKLFITHITTGEMVSPSPEIDDTDTEVTEIEEEIPSVGSENDGDDVEIVDSSDDPLAGVVEEVEDPEDDELAALMSDDMEIVDPDNTESMVMNVQHKPSNR